MREFVFSTFIVILLPDHRRDSLTASHVSTFPYPAVFLPISNIPGAPGAKENDDDARVIVGNTRNNRARPSSVIDDTRMPRIILSPEFPLDSAKLANDRRLITARPRSEMRL